MTKVLVDTSACMAFTVRSDARHREAVATFERLAAEQATLVTSSYVLVETYALLCRRIGLDAVASFREAMLPLLDVVWVDRELHEKSVDLWLKRKRRTLSLVDAVSFVLFTELKLDAAFAFDSDFDEEGIPPA
ncbi:MAG: type II toxin-antitoxin system VapC family toxin [Myxococcota bacterium]